ncbi:MULTISPECIES: hypothetical protein [Clostridiaceae]|uniref:hypothetical protein n=1 Tax=Clostridiaceae TaxID=31979 RepID=UPI000AA637C2|nr:MULTISPECIES: hypothetical protein [Clostridiaceae]
MPKDSQPDNKKARMEKCNYQTPITRETAKGNPTSKKVSNGLRNKAKGEIS